MTEDTEYDPYALPPAEVQEPPVSLLAALRKIGPGIILAGTIVGSGELLLTTLQAPPGEGKPEVLDLDLRTRSGRTLPVRVFHKLAFGADGKPGASRNPPIFQ